MTVIKLKGFDGIDAGLKRMDKAVRADVLARVGEESADGMLVDYTYGAPPTIRRGVRVREVEKRPDRAVVAVGSRHPLVHIFEFGTKPRRTDEGYRRGRIIKRGFARRAFDTNVGAWFRRTGELLWREVKRAGR